jgi:hypothetical protein
MKYKFLSNQFISLWFSLLVLIFVTGCTDAATLQDQPEAPVKTPTHTVLSTTNQPVVEIDTTPTEIDIPLSPTATPSPTKKPVPTLQPVSPLSVEQELLLEASAKLAQELMQTNGGCQLPCWWGIELEESLETVNREFDKIFDEKFDNDSLFYVSRFKVIDEDGTIRLGYHNPVMSGIDVSITTNFHFVDGQVQFIDVLAERPLRQYGEEKLIRDWENYSISSILQQYGKPPYVYLFPQSIADPGPLNFNLLLYYPELGFKFEYGPFDVSSSETQTELCLDLQNIRQISLSLYNPEFVHLRSNYLLPPALNPEAEEFLHAWTWEAITGMDLDMFYELYKSSNPECIQITPK